MSAVQAFDKNKVGVEEAFDVEAIMSQTAHVKGVLTAPYMERYTTTPPYTQFPRGLKVVFYNDSLSISSVLTSRYGKYMDGQNDIYLRDSVVFLSLKEMRRLDCKDLKWDAQKALFITEKFCRFATPFDTLYGKGFRANQDFSWYEFDDVYGSFAPPDSTL